MEVAISLGRYSLARLSAAEHCLVHGISRTARSPLARCFAIALSRLGNGWLYLVLGAGCLLAVGVSAVPVLTAGLLNALVLHGMYPLIKRRVARPRPYQSDPTLVPLLRVLDQHSFPSGHAMTLPAALVPLVLQFPQTIALASATCLLMAWSRLASAHHYPSDVAAGAVLGFSVSYPISVCVLATSHPVA